MAFGALVHRWTRWDRCVVFFQPNTIWYIHMPLVRCKEKFGMSHGWRRLLVSAIHCQIKMFRKLACVISARFSLMTSYISLVICGSTRRKIPWTATRNAHRWLCSFCVLTWRVVLCNPFALLVSVNCRCTVLATRAREHEDFLCAFSPVIRLLFRTLFVKHKARSVLSRGNFRMFRVDAHVVFVVIVYWRAVRATRSISQSFQYWIGRHIISDRVSSLWWCGCR